MHENPIVDFKFVLNRSESLTKAFGGTQSLESSGTLLKTKKCQMKMDYLFSRKIQNHFRRRWLFLGWFFFFFFSPDMFIRHLQTIALQNLFKYVWKTAQQSRTFFDWNTNLVYDKTAIKKSWTANTNLLKKYTVIIAWFSFIIGENSCPIGTHLWPSNADLYC